MSNKPAAMLANYTHAEFKPGLKVCRIVLEIPQERRKEFFDAFGYPDPANPVPVAIARLDPTAVSQPSSAPERAAEGPTASIPLISPQEMRETRKTPFRELKRAAQAALKLDDPEFRKWLTAKYPGMHNELGSFDAVLKHALGIDSKTQLDSDPIAGERWDKLLASFDYRGRI